MGVECDNGGPTNGCQPEQTDSGRILGKVVGPYVLTGMKEGHQVAGQRIEYPGGGSFAFITSAAGKTQVVKRGLATLGVGMI